MRTYRVEGPELPAKMLADSLQRALCREKNSMNPPQDPPPTGFGEQRAAQGQVVGLRRCGRRVGDLRHGGRRWLGSAVRSQPLPVCIESEGSG